MKPADCVDTSAYIHTQLMCIVDICGHLHTALFTNSGTGSKVFSFRFNCLLLLQLLQIRPVNSGITFFVLLHLLCHVCNVLMTVS